MHIDNYQFGKIVIEGKEFRSDLIIYSNRVKSDWWRKKGHQLCLEDISEVIESKPEMIIFGTGAMNRMQILPETEKYLHSQGIKLIALPTEKAVETYNRLISEGEKSGLRSCSGGVVNIVICLHLTC